MENIESKLVEQFENEILNWLNSENENGTYIAAILVEIARQEFLKLNEPAVMPSLPDDAVRSNEQNLRMREWFKERTGLKDALLSEHMEVIDKMLKGNGA